MRINAEEKVILEKLSVKQLQVLQKFREAEDTKVMLSIINALLDSDKEYFMTLVDPEPNSLFRKHALYQGGRVMFERFLRIVKSAEHELQRREEERQKLK